MAEVQQRNADATCFVGNLDEKFDEDLLWEMFVQVGPVVGIHMPKDKVTGKHQGYGFVEFRGEDDVEYAIKVMNMVKVYGKALKVSKSSQDRKTLDVGANLFIGNLDPMVDEKMLFDTFSAFGAISKEPKIMVDPETNQSKGFGFLSFETFESSDLAIECMHGQFFCNRTVVVQYALKKDTPGECHGSEAERRLAAAQPQKFKAHTLFSGGSGDAISTVPYAIGSGARMGMEMPPPPPMMMQTWGMPPMGMSIGQGAPYGMMMPPPYGMMMPGMMMGGQMPPMPMSIPMPMQGMFIPPPPPMGGMPYAPPAPFRPPPPPQN